MEKIFTFLFFSLSVALVELCGLMGMRATSTSHESRKNLHELVFKSGYRFFWPPKALTAFALVLLAVGIVYIDDEDAKANLFLALIVGVLIYCGLIFFEAFRTKE